MMKMKTRAHNMTVKERMTMAMSHSKRAMLTHIQSKANIAKAKEVLNKD